MYYIDANTNSYVSIGIYNCFETVSVAMDFMEQYIKKQFDGWRLEVSEDRCTWKVYSPHKSGLVADVFYEFRISECEKYDILNGDDTDV